MTLEAAPFPEGSPDEAELLIQWLDYLRGAVLRKVAGLDDAGARWTPGERLLPLVGVVRHLANVEWRWIDGGFLGCDVDRRPEEFAPGEDALAEVVDRYRARAAATDAFARATPLATRSPRDSWAGGNDLRFVLLHLINETARHAGHADATRELLDGTTGG